MVTYLNKYNIYPIDMVTHSNKYDNTFQQI